MAIFKESCGRPVEDKKSTSKVPHVKCDLCKQEFPNTDVATIYSLNGGILYTLCKKNCYPVWTFMIWKRMKP